MSKGSRINSTLAPERYSATELLVRGSSTPKSPRCTSLLNGPLICRLLLFFSHGSAHRSRTGLVEFGPSCFPSALRTIGHSSSTGPPFSVCAEGYYDSDAGPRRLALDVRSVRHYHDLSSAFASDAPVRSKHSPVPRTGIGEWECGRTWSWPRATSSAKITSVDYGVSTMRPPWLSKRTDPVIVDHRKRVGAKNGSKPKTASSPSSGKRRIMPRSPKDLRK
jgi:hypothetical protein